MPATDDQGTAHTATTVLLVHDPAVVTAARQGLWTSLAQRLQAGDLSGALSFVGSVLQERMTQVWQQMGAALPVVAATLGTLHVTDRVGDLIRPWVFTVPVPVRYPLAFDAGLTRAVLRVFLRTVFGWPRRRPVQRGLLGTRSGSVTAIQRFGGSLNINLPFQALVFDGIYRVVIVLGGGNAESCHSASWGARRSAVRTVLPEARGEGWRWPEAG